MDVLQAMQIETERPLSHAVLPGLHLGSLLLRAGVILLPALIPLAGCGLGKVIANPVKNTIFIALGSNTIDTNCTGCNSISMQGSLFEQFTAAFADGSTAPVMWAVSGGDALNGPGSVSPSGQYSPPSYLTADSVKVLVTATLESNPNIKASSVLTVMPGFLQPLTPENVALGVNGAVKITGYLAEAGGSTGINFDVWNAIGGTSSGLGTLSGTSCKRSKDVFTSCTVTYNAPGSVASTGVTYVRATVGASSSRTSMVVLLNTAGVSSSPLMHQAKSLTPMQLGSSGGNNNDFDSSKNQIVDCCSGTLGALLKGSDNKEYLLSNNHVLARSDQGNVGDTIIQPGLIDNNCVPDGDGPGTAAVGTLSGWLPLNSSATNVDAAIARVVSGTVDSTGSILELGAKMPDGTLAAAPPGISSTGGKGEAAWLQMRVAKSGRTTGQTCAEVSATNVDVYVDYFTDCAETEPYLSRMFKDQIAISGNGFSDAGDSGSLVVDTNNAEPVGLFFAGGTDGLGVSQAVANPAPEVLNELNTQLAGGATYTFAGTADHAVSCLSYGDNTVSEAQARTLSDAEVARAEQALGAARALVNPAAGILGVASGKSNDHPGEAAILVYVDSSAAVHVPATVGDVRTQVVVSDGRAAGAGVASPTNPGSSLQAGALEPALAFKQHHAPDLMKQNPWFFGIGVGESLDNPKDAALVIYVDRKLLSAQLPQTFGGFRTRYIVMDRMHVTRSYAKPLQSRLHCMPHKAKLQPDGFDGVRLVNPLALDLKF